MIQQREVRVARLYDTPSPDDGWRVLVDRIWPRGIRKEGAPFDEWCKEVAPSPQLRRWYDHQPDRLPEFRRRYEEELEDPQRQTAVQQLRERAMEGPVTLLTASKDLSLSHAVVIQAALQTSG